MLLNDLFSITKIESQPDGSEVHAWVELNPVHSVFEGHFPGKPVLPGVCTVHIIKEVAAAVTGKELTLSRSHTIKFQAPIDPLVNNCLQIDLKSSRETDSLSVNAQVGFAGKKFCSFRGSFAIKT